MSDQLENSQTVKVQKNYGGIDLAKILLALFVVAIHTHPLTGVTNILANRLFTVVVKLAVPYFFIASGFFLFTKLSFENRCDLKSKIIKQYLARISLLYFSWTAIFLPISIYGLLTNEHPGFFDILIFVRGVLILGENFYSWPLWYLLSMIYSLLLINYLVERRRSLSYIFSLSLVMYVIFVLINQMKYGHSMDDRWSQLDTLLKITIVDGRLFMGMLYLMIGAFFAQKSRYISAWLIIVLFTVGVISQVWQVPIISQLLYALCPLGLFYFSLKIGLNRKVSYVLRKASSAIYFLHMIVLFIYTVLFEEFPYYGPKAFLISAVIPLFLVPVIIKYEKRLGFLKVIF